MKNFINKYIIIVFGFYAFWLGGVPFVYSKLIPIVCANVSHNSAYNINIDTPKLRLNVIPTAKFSAKTIHITNKNTKDNFIITSPSIKIRILPLLSGKININEIYAENIDINAYLNQNVVLDKDFINKIKNTPIKCSKAKIKKLKLSFWQKDISTPIVYNSNNFFYQKNGHFVKLNLDSNLNIQGKTSATKIELYIPKNNTIKNNVVSAEISNFNLAPLEDYLKNYIPKDIKDIKGVINLKVDNYNLNSTFENCAIIMHDSSKSIILPELLNVSSKFNLTSNLLNFDYLKLQSKNIDINILGSISHYLGDTLSQLNLKVQLFESKAEDIIKMLPPIIVEELNVPRLKHYKFYGDTIGNFSLKGSLFEPEINGEVFIRNGILTKPIKNAKGATIKLDFTGKHVDFDVTVPAGNNEKVFVKGNQELYNIKYADMRIWSTQNVDLALAEEKIIPIHEILNFIIGPVPIMDIKGKGNLDITVKGNRKTPHIWGKLNFRNVQTSFNDIPDLVLKDADATLTFNDQNAEFSTIKGFVNGHDISINGICNLQGKFDFDINSKLQNINYLYKAIKNSPMLAEINQLIPDLDTCTGFVGLKLKVFGEAKDINNLIFNKNVFSSGEITLLGNNFGLNGINVKNTKGKVAYNGLDAKAEISSLIGTSAFNAIANIKNNFADININAPHLNLNDVLNSANDIKNDFGNIYLSIIGKYKGSLKNIEYDKINFNAKILGTAPENKLKLSNGEINFSNNKIKVNNLSGKFTNSQSDFYLSLIGDNISSNPDFNGNITLNNFDLRLLNEFSNYSIIPQDIKNNIKQIEFGSGNINLKGNINGNRINAYTDISNVTAIYVPINLPIKVLNGNLSINNNTLKLNKINLLADDMPVLIHGNIQDILKKQIFDIYLSSKPNQNFIDKYINKNQLYPIKIKGDIVYSAKLKGVKNDFDLKADVNMLKDSSVYYLGATVGDVENAIVLNLDTKVQNGNELKIKEFGYDKLISSQTGRQTKLNMLKAKGGIDIFKDDLQFHNLYIKTQNPTDARIFNIIFRKPNIKQGQFTSDLRFNGMLSDPKLIGTFHIFETNIPFLDTTMKNISFVFKDRIIDLTSSGEILGNDITFKGTLKNKLTIPYYVENADLYTKVLDLNHITNKLKESEVENAQALKTFENFDLGNVIIKNINTYADSIYLRNIIAENFEAQSSLTPDKILKINKFRFNVAKGSLDGQFKYNLVNNDSAIRFSANNINANDLSYALFDLNNQIYGDLTGNVDLTCNGESFENCMKTLNGTTNFNVAQGRIPKLGSLEYLLKAGNLVKGGFTGVSINSVIDLITPLKTGEFSNIFGTVSIKDGIADNIEITSAGNDLSLFITGTYNFSTSIADMKVFGLLARKISTMFGPIGNVSINTLFNMIPGVDLSKDTKLKEQINKIPGIELSNKAYRKFIAIIKGDIDSDDYVTSFKWIN